MPKIIDHEQMRYRILDESHRIFSEEGYQAISMRRLAERIGVTTGVLYHYFKNKEQLVQAVLRRGLEHSGVTGYETPVFPPVPQDLEISERIRAVFSQIAEDDDLPITNIMLLTDYFRDLQDPKAIEASYNSAYQFLESFRRSLGLSKKQEDLARFVLVYMVGMHVIRLWTNKRMTIKEFSKIFFRFSVFK
jgi:AcrR family transcriptional regulator